MESSCERRHDAISLRTAILAGCHVLVAMLAAFAPRYLPLPDTFDEIPMAIVALSQIGLLSLWFTFGKAPMLSKVVVASIVAPVLAVLLDTAENQGRFALSLDLLIFIQLILAPIPFIIGICWVAKRWGHIQLLDQKAEDSGDGLNFSIFHLIVWTVVVSAGSAASRVLAGSHLIPSVLLLVCIWTFAVCSLALASLWSALGAKPPHLRCLVVTSTAFGGGLLLGYAAVGDGNWLVVVGVAVISWGISLIAIVSLLVIRSCGYRFVRLVNVESVDRG
jgi:hypothetical protein